MVQCWSLSGRGETAQAADWTAHLFQLGPGEAQVCEVLEACAQVIQRVLHNARVAQEQHAQLPVLQADLPSMQDGSGSTLLDTNRCVPLPQDTSALPQDAPDCWRLCTVTRTSHRPGVDAPCTASAHTADDGLTSSNVLGPVCRQKGCKKHVQTDLGAEQEQLGAGRPGAEAEEARVTGSKPPQLSFGHSQLAQHRHLHPCAFVPPLPVA